MRRRGRAAAQDLCELLEHVGEALAGRGFEQAAHEHGRDRRHHLAHDVRPDPGPGRRLIGHLPAHLGAEELTEDGVALAAPERRERHARLLEETRILARTHHAQEIGEAGRIGGVALEAEGEGRHQGFHGAARLVEAEAELPRHVLHGGAALRRTHQIEEVEHRALRKARPSAIPAQPTAQSPRKNAGRAPPRGCRHGLDDEEHARARGFAPAHSGLPDLNVPFMTGYTRHAIVHNGVLDPDAQLIPKPFTLGGLGAKMRAVLGRQPVAAPQPSAAQ